jgi:hypothetical protein
MGPNCKLLFIVTIALIVYTLYDNLMEYLRDRE